MPTAPSPVHPVHSVHHRRGGAHRGRRPRRTSLLAAGALAMATLAAACSSGSSGSGDQATGGTTGGALPACPVKALDSATQPVEVTVWHTQAAKNLETLQALADQYNAAQSKLKVVVDSFHFVDSKGGGGGGGGGGDSGGDYEDRPAVQTRGSARPASTSAAPIAEDDIPF